MLFGIRNRIRQFSSAFRILQLLLLLAVFGPAAIVAFVTLQSRSLLIDNATNRASRMAELLAKHSAATFDTYNGAFSRIDEHLLHSDGPSQERSLHEYLGEIDREMKSVDGIVLIGSDGVAIAHSRYFPAPKTYIGDREYIQDVRDAPPDNRGQYRLTQVQGKDGLTISAPVESRYSGKLVLPVARARRDGSGAFTGALALSLSQAYFEDFFRALALTKSDRVALLRGDWRVLAETSGTASKRSGPHDPRAGPVIVADAATETDLPQRLGEGIVDYVSRSDDIRRISRLVKLDGYPVFVEVGFGLDAVLAPWRRQALVNLVIAGLASLILFAVARLALDKTRAEVAMQALLLSEARQRAEAETALRQSQKMEALGQLTGGIAHDFNNLLNIVLMNLELATKRMADPAPPDPARLQGYLRGATEGAERGVALTRRLLAFARRTETAQGPVQVSDLVQGLHEMLRQAAGPSVRLTLDCPRGLPAALADPNAFETALLNLVVNARDAMPDGGQLHVAVRAESDPEPSERRYVALSVRDSGTGMDSATVARVTQPFFTTKEAGKGSGLGLAMVDRFATEGDGKLVIESRPGAGTTVEIWMPVAQEGS